MGTVIPRAKVGGKYVGGSRGFEVGAYGFDVLEQQHEFSNPVKIASVDPRSITPSLSKQLYDEVSARILDPEERTVEVYRLMGMVSQAALTDSFAGGERVNPFQPGRYVVPSVGLNGAQLGKTDMAPPLPRPVAGSPVQLEKLSQPAWSPQLAGEPAQQAADDTAELMMFRTQEQMRQLQQNFELRMAANNEQLMSLISRQLPPAAAPERAGHVDAATAQLERLPPLPGEISATDTSREQQDKNADVTYTKEDLKRYTLAAVDAALKKLNIPGLSFQAGEPNYEVAFDFGEMGETTARYHWVGAESGGLFLVFDTRFKYCGVYTPPDLGNSKLVTVRLRQDGRNVEYRCGSTKFVQTFGVFKIINLVVVDKNSTQDTISPVVTEISPADTVRVDEDDLAFIMGMQ